MMSAMSGNLLLSTRVVEFVYEDSPSIFDIPLNIYMSCCMLTVVCTDYTYYFTDDAIHVTNMGMLQVDMSKLYFKEVSKNAGNASVFH